MILINILYFSERHVWNFFFLIFRSYDENMIVLTLMNHQFRLVNQKKYRTNNFFLIMEQMKFRFFHNQKGIVSIFLSIRKETKI